MFFFVHSGTIDYVTFLHLCRPGSYTSVDNANTFNLPLSALFAFPHSRGTNSNRALVFILPPQGFPIHNSTLHCIPFIVILITTILSATLQTSNLLRQIAISILLIPYSLLPNNLHNIQRQACMVGCPSRWCETRL